jgi:hypothetical protein
MKVKGEPLQVRFTHVNNEFVQKTIARATIYDYNVPTIVAPEFFEMFAKWNPDAFDLGCDVKLYAETVCKDSDDYDPVVGERVARKKLMKHFMSMLHQAAMKRIRNLESQKQECDDLAKFAEECEQSIIKYLKEQ